MTKPLFRTVFAGELHFILGFITLLWLVFLLDRILPLEVFALYPRHLSGLPGIALSPFLHKDISHLLSNTVPLLALLTLLAGSRANSPRLVVSLVILSGCLLWLFGRSLPVIGASGLVFGLIGFLIADGLIEKRLVALLISIFVGVSYGATALAGILPGQQGISWDGHLFGLIAGILCAWLFSRRQG